MVTSLQQSKYKLTKICVLTGFLGAGKTTLLINLIQQLPKNCKVAILKNEFGDSFTDSQLLEAQLKLNSFNKEEREEKEEKEKESKNENSSKKNFEIKEMINGCLCCILVGQLKNALIELQEYNQPELIFIETSGSAFPAPIAWQIRELSKEGYQFELDSILTVIDCLNFMGYEDTSYTAKLQAKYTDVIILNKCEEVDDQKMDLVIDKINELNDETPKIKFLKDKNLDLDLLINLDTKLFNENKEEEEELKIFFNKEHHNKEIDLILIKSIQLSFNKTLDQVNEFFLSLDKECIYRIKGNIRINNNYYLINFAFGRGSYHLIENSNNFINNLNITIMGIYLKDFKMKIQNFFNLEDNEIQLFLKS